MSRFQFQPLTEAVAGVAREGRLSLVAADGAAVPGGRLRLHLGPRIIGGRYFRAFIDRGDGQAPRRLLQGLYNDGPYPGQNWIEVFDVDVPEELAGVDGWEGRLEGYLRPLAGVIPDGGHLMIEYEKPAWRTTQLGLLAGIPPVATAMGALLFDLGAGDSFKDWYFPEGGQEGGRKLQGNKAHSAEQRKEMWGKRAAELRRFLDAPSQGDGATDARARAEARRLLAELRDPA